jgi:hypothetical protein
MRKCKYYVGCYAHNITGDFKLMRVITGMNNGVPSFSKVLAPLEFTSDEADKLMGQLLDNGWMAVTIRAPHDRPFMCMN